MKPRIQGVLTQCIPGFMASGEVGLASGERMAGVRRRTLLHTR
jgi:hypothetical protein